MLSCIPQTAQQISPNDRARRGNKHLSIFVQGNHKRTQLRLHRPWPLAQNGKPRRVSSYRQLPSLLRASWYRVLFCFWICSLIACERSGLGIANRDHYKVKRKRRQKMTTFGAQPRTFGSFRNPRRCEAPTQTRETREKRGGGD